ncbi:hypothetical protein MBLNU459_g7702t1 [Dothideomycetes sp. NU459]
MSITVYPPFGTNTSSEKDGLILLATILNIAISILALPFTVLRKGKVFGWSDAAACGAVTLNLVETIPLLLSRSHGLGTSSSLLVTSQTQNAQYFFSSEQLYILTLGIHKCWVALFAWRLAASSNMPRFKKGCVTALALATVWTIASMIGIAVQCSVGGILPPQGSTYRCPAQSSRWLVICIFDGLTDLIGFGLIVWLILPLRIESSDKTAIMFSFFLKIGCIPLSIVRLISIRQFVSSTDPGLDIVAVIIWQNAHLGWAALSAAAPSMLWMRSSFELTQINEEGRGLPSIFGNGGGSSGARTDYAIDSDVADTRRGRCSKKATSNSSIQLRRLGGRKSILKSAREEDNVGVIRADGSDYNAQVQAVPRGHRASIGSGESEMNLIVVDVSRSVTHQTIVK